MANDVSLAVRVSANLDEMRAKLAQADAIIDTTSTAMKSMANAYDGTRTIANANAAMLQIEKLGGASTLTATEQAKVNRLMEEALEKYKALGREAPAGMQALADDTKQVETHSSTLRDTVRGLATDFLAMFTARAAFQFVKDTVNEASALKDLSNQTHINVEELQTLAGAMREFGVDQDELGKGLYKLSRGIAGGDTSVAAGLHMMGLSLKDVEGLNGEALFLKIEHGLSTLQGGLRDTAAAELFGGKLGAAMAGASDGIDGALESWKRLNHVASTESVDALDTYGEAIERMEKSLSSMAANLMGPVAQGFNVVVDAAGRAGAMQTFWAMMKDGVGSSGPLTSWIFGTDNLATLLDHLNQKTTTATSVTRERTAALTEQQKVEQFMAALERDSAVKLSDEQLKNLDRLRKMGELTSANAAAIGVTTGQLEQYKTAVEAATKAEKDMKAGEQELAEASQKMWDDLLKHDQLVADERGRLESELQVIRMKQSGTATDAQIADVARWEADLTRRLHKAGLETSEFYDDVEKVSKAKMDDILIDWTAVSGNSSERYRRDLQQVADKAQATYDYMVAHSAEFSNATIGHFGEIAQAAAYAADHWEESFETGADGAVKSIEKITDAAKAAKQAIDAMMTPGWSGAASSVMSPELMNALHFAGLIDARGQFTGTQAQFASIQSQFPSRDVGGPVVAGQPYYIGRGAQPELFVPPQSGTMIPAGASPAGMHAGGTSIVNHIYVTKPFGTPDAIGDAIVARQRALGRRFAS